MNKKQIDAWLKLQAAKLPLIGYKTKETHLVAGQEANELTDGTDANPLGDRFNDEGVYRRKYPVINTVNHYRRMRKAYKDNGMQGVHDYITNVEFLIEKQQANG